ncbi:MAG: hypothetical protein WA210_20310, partial [Burkholderiaceae bacterium]
PFDRTEWRPPTSHPPVALVNHDALRRAAVDAANLSGIPQWDTFCTYVQGWIARIERNTAGMRSRMEHADLTDDGEILRLRQGIVLNNTRIETLLQVIRFPTDILDANGQIKETVDG